MLWLVVLTVLFFSMVTALIYQFRGWLAALMTNKRHRRTIVVVAAAFSMSFRYLPFAVSFFPPGVRRAIQSVVKDAVAGAVLVNIVVPFGWLPFGAQMLVEGRLLPSFLCGVGLAAITVASLRRSYRTTIRLYSGQLTAGTGKGAAAVAEPRKPAVLSGIATEAFFERRLPFLPEGASVVALAGFRSLFRAPEVKLRLLSPVFVAFFLIATRGWSRNASGLLQPLMASGGVALVFMSISQFSANIFAFDRAGFRSFVLSPMARWEILLGKNVAMSPFALAEIEG